MICPDCSGKTKVVDTRSPEKSAHHKRVQLVIGYGRRVFGWWSDDFVVRLRECVDCGEQFRTIEVAIVDLKNAFEEIADNRVTDRPWANGVEEGKTMELRH
jgi:transcriptional regulator NrdR family protein